MAPKFESTPKSSALEQEPFVHEITAEFIINFFQSEQFQKQLSASTQRYLKNKREFGFEVLKKSDSEELYFGRVVGGELENETALSRSSETLVRRLRREGVEPYTFATFHIHPHFEDDPIIVPSGIEGDLGRSNGLRRAEEDILKLSLPSIDFIGAIRGDGSVKILAFRESAEFNPWQYRNAFIEMDESLNDVQDQEEVLRLMKQMRYEVVVLNSDPEGRFDHESIEQLGILTYQAKRIP